VSSGYASSLAALLERMGRRPEVDDRVVVSPDAPTILMTVPDNEAEIRLRNDTDGSKRRANALKLLHYLH
jgi:hypothetical protein